MYKIRIPTSASEKMGSEYMYLGLNAMGSTMPDNFKPAKQIYVQCAPPLKKPEKPKSAVSQRNSNAVMEDSEEFEPIECWFDKPRICRIGACSEVEDLSYQSLVENQSVVPGKLFFDEFSSCSVSGWK